MRQSESEKKEARENKKEKEKEKEEQQREEEEHMENEESDKKNKKSESPFSFFSNWQKNSEGGKFFDPKKPTKFQWKYVVLASMLGLFGAQVFYEFYKDGGSVSYTVSYSTCGTVLTGLLLGFCEKLPGDR